MVVDDFGMPCLDTKIFRYKNLKVAKFLRYILRGTGWGHQFSCLHLSSLDSKENVDKMDAEAETDPELPEKEVDGSKDELVGAGKECYDMLKQIQAREIRQSQENQEASSVLHPETSANPKRKVLDEADLHTCLGSDDVDVDGAVGASDSKGQSDPIESKKGWSHSSQKLDQGTLQTKSLFELLNHPSAKEDSQSDRIWVHLWRLTLRLRANEGKGCDSSYIKNHKTCRWLSGKMNWHQQAEHACKLLNLESGLSANRISRMQAWKATASTAATKILQVPESRLPTVLASGHVVLALCPIKPQAWRVALVLSCWTLAGRAVKLTHLPVPMEKLHSVRLAFMEPEPEKPEGAFVVDSRSIALSVPAFMVALLLECSQQFPAHNSWSCVLDPQCLSAVQKAHLITKWPKTLTQICEDANPVRTNFAHSTPKRRAKPKSQSNAITSPRIGGLRGEQDKDDKGDQDDKDGKVEKKERKPKFPKPTECKTAMDQEEIILVPWLMESR